LGGKQGEKSCHKKEGGSNGGIEKNGLGKNSGGRGAQPGVCSPKKMRVEGGGVPPGKGSRDAKRKSAALGDTVVPPIAIWKNGR